MHSFDTTYVTYITVISELDSASYKDIQQKRISKNVYAKTREECETLLAELIKEMKAEIQTEKERLKQEESM